LQFRGHTTGTTTRLRSPEGEDTIEDGEVIGISAEDQLKLRALRIKNNHLQKQKEILEAKRQRVTMQANVRQMILDEEQKAQELEKETTLIQSEGTYNLQRDPLAPPVAFQQNTQVEDPFHP
jgi:bacterioferritin (cytochrome b1)